MKKAISSILLSITLIAQPVLACDWSEGIERSGDKFIYTAECHDAVGDMKKNLEDKEIEIKELRSSLDLKNQALEKADKRIMKWREESYEQFDHLQTQYRLQDKQKWVWFALGVAATSAAVWGAGHLD